MFRSWKVVLAALAAAVVVGGGVGIGVMQLRAGDANEPGPPNIDTRAWVSRRGDDGWLVRHPGDWEVTPFRLLVRNRFTRTGATISNAQGAIPRTDTGPLDLRALPPTAVVIEIVREQGGPIRTTTTPDTTFPLALLGGTAFKEGEFDGINLDLVVDGRAGWAVTVRIGRRAHARDIETARRIVSSFGFEDPGQKGGLTLEERMIAHEIAESYRGARKALKGRPHTHPDFASDRTGDPACSGHRCGLVVFQITGGLRFRVLVDLEERRALKFG